MNDAETLIEAINDFLAGSRLPVRLDLDADSEFEVSIRRLHTASQHRRQGYAGRVMEELVRQSDLHGVPLSLEALPDEDSNMDLPSLVTFYARFGFVGEIDRDGESAWLYREPAPSPRANR